jgi:transcriptional regulator with XRE-family HTH domain
MSAWNPFAVAFGRAMQEIRTRKRLKQSVVAYKAQISKAYCSNIENAYAPRLKNIRYDDAYAGKEIAQALALNGLSMERYIFCYNLSRTLSQKHRGHEWKGNTSRFIEQTLMREPELVSILWPAFLLATKKEPANLRARIRAVTEEYLVQRVRDYIEVTHPPISVEKDLVQLKTAA